MQTTIGKITSFHLFLFVLSPIPIRAFTYSYSCFHLFLFVLSPIPIRAFWCVSAPL
jgi:hypothetical protein